MSRLPARSTRGQRSTEITKAEMAEVEEFWGALLKEELEDDPDFEEPVEEEDDDDISIGSEDDDDELSNPAKAKSYKQSAKPSFIQSIEKLDDEEDEDEEEEEEEEEEENKRKSKKKKVATPAAPSRSRAGVTRSSPPITSPPSPTTTRKSLRPSVQALIVSNDLLKLKMASDKKIPKKKMAAERILTQKELLAEAKLTEKINQDSLQNMLKREEDKKKSLQSKKQIQNTTITFTDGFFPEFTGLPAKYIDPHSKTPFATVEAYQALKDRPLPPKDLKTAVGV
eukprot:gene4975-5786_t